MQSPEPSRLLELPQEVLQHVWKYLERPARGPDRYTRGGPYLDPNEMNTRDMVALRRCSREARIITSTFITSYDLVIQPHRRGADDAVQLGLLHLGMFPRNATLMKLRLYVSQFRRERFWIAHNELVYPLPSRFFTQAAHMLGALQTLELDTTGVGGRDQ